MSENAIIGAAIHFMAEGNTLHGGREIDGARCHQNAVQVGKIRWRSAFSISSTHECTRCHVITKHPADPWLKVRDAKS